MPAAIDITGQRFGRLVALRLHAQSKYYGLRNRKWLCQCICGKQAIVVQQCLTSSHTKSCGCLRSDVARAQETEHGQTGTQIYNCWKGMIDRCTNPRDKRYADYGGRGISVCTRWRVFANFLADMGPRPAGHSIDRIDNDGNYEPGNCRWATAKQQRGNRRPQRPASQTHGPTTKPA